MSFLQMDIPLVNGPLKKYFATKVQRVESVLVASLPAVYSGEYVQGKYCMGLAKASLVGEIC